MNKSEKDTLYVIILLVVFFLLDIMLIGGILYKGHANFPELIQHLKS